MNRITNPLLVLVPAELLGLIIFFLLVVGGLLITAGARATGKALVFTAIAIPFISVLVQVLMNAFFASLPEALIMPVAWFIMFIAYGMSAMVAIRFLFGDKAVEEAKGQLLADTVKGVLKLLFKWPVMLVWMGALIFFTLMA
jgi:hypothetical protein